MNATTTTWAMLVTATLGSFVVAEYVAERKLAVAAILLVAAFKVRLILRNFMELRAAPAVWRVTFDVWTAACASMIIGLCWYATG
jgi:predicted alpha/beta hydrolase family esterase